MTNSLQMARLLAPEDVHVEQYVSIMHEVREQVPWCFDEDKTEPKRFLLLPRKTDAPLRVVEVCVPFVLVEQVDGSHRTLDLRRYRLAALSESFGRCAFEHLKRSPKESAESSDARNGSSRD